jgi:hypothetical protein
MAAPNERAVTASIMVRFIGAFVFGYY